MIKRIKAHHITVPIFLIFCLALMGLIFGFHSESGIILNVSILAIFLYMIFAFTHHHFDKSITMETILEYILMAVLVLILVIGTLFY